MMETTDPYWIALVIVMIGGVAAIILPYLGKLYDDGTTFNVTYFIPLCFTVIISAITLIPDPVPELTPQVLMSLFVAGYGLQAAGNLITTRIIKK